MTLPGIFRKINDSIVRGGSIRGFDCQSLTLNCRNRLRRFNSGNVTRESSNETTVKLISKPREEPMCRICRLNSEKAREKLISPCSCKGTLAYIHRTCLEKWLKRSGTTYCELCRFNYTIKVVERYSKIYSIRKWLTDDENIDDVQDLIVDSVLTVTFLPIVFICCYGFAAVYSQTPHITVHNLLVNSFEMKQKLWLMSMLGFVTVFIVACYLGWLMIRSTHYYRKWANWVRRHGNLTLVLDTSK